MRWLGKFRMAMLTLLRRNAETERLNCELEFHVQLQIAENMTRGMDAENARSTALRSFGNPTVLREQARAEWIWGWLERFWRDLRYGARTLRRSPGFAIIAILVMALGIGATASLFTIVNAVMLKPLPFHDPGRLVMVYGHFRDAGSNSGGFNYNVVSPADFRDWRKKTHSFQDMTAWRPYGVALAGEHEELPESVSAAGGSWNLYRCSASRFAWIHIHVPWSGCFRAGSPILTQQHRSGCRTLRHFRQPSMHDTTTIRAT